LSSICIIKATLFSDWIPDFFEVASVELFVFSISELVALDVVPAASVVLAALEKADAEDTLAPVRARHEVKKIPTAEEVSNNIRFFLFILTIEYQSFQ